MKSSTYASIIATSDGMPVTSVAHNYVNEVEASGVASSILALGEQTTETFEHKKLHRVLVEGEKGITILTEVNQELILITIAQRDAKLGILFMEIKKIIKRNTKMLMFEKLAYSVQQGKCDFLLFEKQRLEALKVFYLLLTQAFQVILAML